MVISAQCIVHAGAISSTVDQTRQTLVIASRVLRERVDVSMFGLNAAATSVWWTVIAPPTREEFALQGGAVAGRCVFIRAPARFRRREANSIHQH